MFPTKDWLYNTQSTAKMNSLVVLNFYFLICQTKSWNSQLYGEKKNESGKAAS